jgi:nucleoside-diphosphate-sugar epimerase
MREVVAVTGAGGYIGSRLVGALAPRPVRPLVRRVAPGTNQISLDRPQRGRGRDRP